MRQNPPNARFWVWHNDGWVKLTLRPGDKLAYHWGGPHEEGWSYTGVVYRYSGESVLRFETTKSQDCDGRMGTQNDARCPLDQLQARDPFDKEDEGWGGPQEFGILLPAWQPVSFRQRDYTAEAMGY